MRPLVRFAAPIAAFAIAGMIYNYVRFGSPTEFGHTYLSLATTSRSASRRRSSSGASRATTTSSRNLAVAFTLLPELLPRAPWIQISGHGLAMWFTTPALLLLLWPREKNPLHRTLWLTIAARRAADACSTRTPAGSSSATGSASTTWCSSSCCSRSAAGR